MKILFLFALVCVAHGYTHLKEATNTKEVYDYAWHNDGERIVTFGSTKCRKAYKSKWTMQDYLTHTKACNGLEFIYLQCNKAAPGTCFGLFENFNDNLEGDDKVEVYHLPRTFYIRKIGDQAKVKPITRSGRLHSHHRKDPEFFERWCEKARKL